MSNPPPESDSIDVNGDASPVQVSRRSQRIRRAIIVSVVVHFVVVLALLGWYMPAAKTPLASEASSSSESSRDASPRNSLPASEVPAKRRGSAVADAEIQRSLQAQIEAAQQVPDEQKLDQLEKHLKRLESVSSQESTDEVASKIASSLGLDTEQYAVRKPKDVEAGDIDLDKAQVADVTRARNSEGGWDYVTTLVDDRGRELEIPVTEAEGQAMYRAFEQMKKFPIAAGIYRKVVMPMVQKMVEAQSQGK